jgi:hypothetical protein
MSIDLYKIQPVGLVKEKKITAREIPIHYHFVVHILPPPASK